MPGLERDFTGFGGFVFQVDIFGNRRCRRFFEEEMDVGCQTFQCYFAAHRWWGADGYRVNLYATGKHFGLSLEDLHTQICRTRRNGCHEFEITIFRDAGQMLIVRYFSKPDDGDVDGHFYSPVL